VSNRKNLGKKRVAEMLERHLQEDGYTAKEAADFLGIKLGRVVWMCQGHGTTSRTEVIRKGAFKDPNGRWHIRAEAVREYATARDAYYAKRASKEDLKEKVAEMEKLIRSLERKLKSRGSETTSGEVTV
jgi:hypothetical protein